MDPLACIPQLGREHGLDGGMGIFLFLGDAEAVQARPAGDVGQGLHQGRRVCLGQETGTGQHARMGSAAERIVHQEAHVQFRIVAYRETMDRLVQRQALGPELGTHAAFSLALVSRAPTMLPLPWLVNTSVSTASGTMPLT